jgi:spermidine synthase
LLLIAVPCPSALAAGAPKAAKPASVLEEEVKSEYSRIRVRRQGSVRSLIFVRDNHDEVIESIVNVKKPYDMQAPYSRYMFASYLFQPRQQQVLIVGLGGGAMVHFLRHYAPEAEVTTVEIDPAVVKLADRYFGVRPGKNLKIVTGDGLQFLEKTDARYDAVYMDAFLKPSADTDATGTPLAMKTIRFYKGVQEKLKAGGVVAFNLNEHKGLEDDLTTLRQAFPQLYVFRLGGGNVVAVGTMETARQPLATLVTRAREIDRRFKTTFSFPELLNQLSR